MLSVSFRWSEESSGFFRCWRGVLLSQRKQHPLFQLYHDVDPDLDHGRHPSGWIRGYGRCDFFLWGERKKTGNPERPARGSVAAIGLGSLLLLQLGCWSLVEKPMLPVIGFGYVLSRALSALSVMLFPPAKKEGLARTFRDNADAGKKNDRSPGSLDHRRCGWYVEYRRQCRNPCGSGSLCNLGLL